MGCIFQLRKLQIALLTILKCSQQPGLVTNNWEDLWFVWFYYFLILPNKIILSCLQPILHLRLVIENIHDCNLFKVFNMIFASWRHQPCTLQTFWWLPFASKSGLGVSCWLALVDQLASNLCDYFESYCCSIIIGLYVPI